MKKSQKRDDEDESRQILKHNQTQQMIQISQQNEQRQKNKPARDHHSSIQHNAIVRQDQYRKCMPLRERIGSWFYNTVRCTNSEVSYVQKLQQIQRKHPINLNQQVIAKLKNIKIVKIKIKQTSRLELDANVIHPFVKVHVVDLKTGCYLQKKYEKDQPIIYHHESITFHEQKNKKYDSSQNNIILPFATNPCDFRKIGNSVCEWNQQFIINYLTEYFFNSNTLILFEILDFNHQGLLFRDTNIYDKDNFYRIAWAYLRPVGFGRTLFGSSKLQLYRYKFNNKKQFNSHINYIPSVYYDFLWNNHQKYQGFLTVQLNSTQPRFIRMNDEAQYPQNLLQQQIIQPDYLQQFAKGQKQIEQVKVTNTNLLRFFRNNGICEVPKQLIYKLQSQKLGCFRTLFVGNYLFAACSTKKHSNIKVFSLQTGEKVMVMKGHRQILYSMTTTPNQKYLITSGSDCFVRIWEIPSVFGQFIDQQQSQVLIRAEIIHTAAVYSAACIYIPLNDTFNILTCCFDGAVRLWEVNIGVQATYTCVTQDFLNSDDRRQKFNKDNKSLKIDEFGQRQKIYPTACVVSQSNYFIVGDSIGDIRIYDFKQNRLNLRTPIKHQELQNDQILCIKIINKNNILIQASDNLIRHFEISTNKLRLATKFSGAQFDKILCDFAISPDNRYIMSPSQIGRPYLWDLKTGQSISTQHLNLDIKGPLVTCAWHPKYNLVSFGGFVQLCPVLVYGNILSQSEQKLVAAQVL